MSFRWKMGWKIHRCVDKSDTVSQHKSSQEKKGDNFAARRTVVLMAFE